MQDSLAQVHIRREGVYPLYTNNYYPPGACITTTRSSNRVALDCDRRTRDQSCTIALNPLLCKRRGGKASSPKKQQNHSGIGNREPRFNFTTARGVYCFIVRSYVCTKSERTLPFRCKSVCLLHRFYCCTIEFDRG